MSKEDYVNIVETEDVVIANSAQLSGAANLTGLRLAGIVMPAAFTGAALTFEVSHDGTTYQELYWNDIAYSVTVAAAKNVSLTMNAFWPWQYVKVKSDSAEGAERTLTLILRPI